jgi:hypothetical protein
MRFSERFGFKPVKTTFQKEWMDQDLRNCLWSAVKIHYAVPSYSAPHYQYQADQLMILYRRLWLDFFKLPLDSLSKDLHVIDLEIRTRFFKWSWHEVYDFIEFVAQNHPSALKDTDFMQYCNTVLEREMSRTDLSTG